MIITPTPAVLVLPGQEVPRSRGTHVSGLIRSIAAHMGVLKPEWVDDPDDISDNREITDQTAITRICMGIAWEEWYIKTQLYRDGVVKHPGEMSVDGIHMTPDGESVDVIITPRPSSIMRCDGPLGTKKMVHIIHEVKATYKSIKTTADFNTQWMWLSQAKCYCKGAKTTYARFHVLHICGNYKFPIQPIAKCWDVEFEQYEIDQNWTLMTEYRDYQEER